MYYIGDFYGLLRNRAENQTSEEDARAFAGVACGDGADLGDAYEPYRNGKHEAESGGAC